MAVIRQSWCKYCRKLTRQDRQESISEGIGCVLILLSGGLFLLIYAPYKLYVMLFPTYRCMTYGRGVDAQRATQRGFRERA